MFRSGFLCSVVGLAAVQGIGCYPWSKVSEHRCGVEGNPILNSASSRRPTSRIGDTLHFRLVLQGPSQANGSATLCVFLDGDLVYHDAWDTRWWWDAPPVEGDLDPDAAVTAAVEGFFDEDAFMVEDLMRTERRSWVGECNWAVYPAIAESLRRMEYRRRTGTPITEQLSRAVLDSLRSLAVDSGAVERIFDELRQRRAVAFRYWRGYEETLQIGWIPSLRSFLLVQCGL